MGEQIRAEDWLPEGWKIEIRVRKSGKKDRYYTDPVNGYIFRSLKDIDRYLLSGKLGKHVTKNKPKGLDDSDDTVNFNLIQHNDVPIMKKSIKSNHSDKKRSRNNSKTGKTGPENSETEKKTGSRSSRGGRGSRPKKKNESTPFFILDPDRCEGSSAVSIPNLSEIIDSMLKEKEGGSGKTVYLSAPDIGSLLGGKMSETGCTDNSSKNPNKSAVNYSSLVSDVKKEGCESESRSAVKPYHEHHGPSPMLEKVIKAGSESPVFADLFEDPCIDFAIKTLTGNNSLFGV
ncbi:uncharacterized protein [Spinacia oleracea]|uniref:Uncharacterized protein isoform X2 n=1 Tax=Spinacia oleracea TaxID=3562 RepID=A0A9R0I3F9_SPIOL|nr:uncharacterized protein LOC110782298 isoform X2 [Spinacia oleracea]